MCARVSTHIHHPAIWQIHQARDTFTRNILCVAVARLHFLCSGHNDRRSSS
jgi:hypothetical protein